MLGVESKAPAVTDNDVKVIEDRERNRVSSAGREYRVGKCKAKIHKDKRTELENVLLEYFKVEAVDEDVIKAVSECF